MTIMASHVSATVRETPHANQTNETNQSNYTNRTNTIIDALKHRARALLNDRTIDPQSGAFIRYALETNDPWLAELVRRADEGELVIEAIDFSDTPPTLDDIASEEKIQALAEMICQASDESAAVLLVLMATLENATHPKVLANHAKHLAFTRCGELNFRGMVDVQVASIEGELLAVEMQES
jgi:hypothetical protein